MIKVDLSSENINPESSGGNIQNSERTKNVQKEFDITKLPFNTEKEVKTLSKAKKGGPD